jgi:hypothetical protein
MAGDRTDGSKEYSPAQGSVGTAKLRSWMNTQLSGVSWYSVSAAPLQ